MQHGSQGRAWFLTLRSGSHSHFRERVVPNTPCASGVTSAQDEAVCMQRARNRARAGGERQRKEIITTQLFCSKGKLCTCTKDFVSTCVPRFVVLKYVFFALRLSVSNKKRAYIYIYGGELRYFDLRLFK